jgi:hypothetical protein
MEGAGRSLLIRRSVLRWTWKDWLVGFVVGQEMGQEAPQTPADPHVVRSHENRLKPCPT